MKAMRFVGVGQPMELQELPQPKAQPGWAVLKVEAAGLCHSDVYILNGALKDTISTQAGDRLATEPPITLGHEIAGTVHALGQGVTGFAVGERVVSGGEIIPESAPGITIDGGFAEFVAVPRDKLQRIPAGVSFEAAAVATDSIATAFHAVRTSGELRAGETVGIVGLGGLGLNGVRTAALCGGLVYGVDINPATFDAARELGALDCHADVEALAQYQPDLIVDFAGTGSTTQAALDAVRYGGRVVLVGLAAADAPIDTHRLVLGRKTIRGSFGRDADDMRHVLEFLSRGRFQPMLSKVRFEDLNEAYERLEHGEVIGRLVTHPGT